MSLYTDISFPFTPGNPVWKSTGENTRTLCIKNTKRAVIDKTGYNQRNYSLACIFSVTLLSPEVNKDRFNSLGRTYIGVNKDNTKILFFILQSKHR